MIPRFALSLIPLCIVHTHGLIPWQSLHQPRGKREIYRQSPVLFLAADETGTSDDSLDGDNENVPAGPMRSRMNDYVSQFLENGMTPKDLMIFSSDDIATATHLIAIPMDTAYELLLELESVQRAILYHCPILTAACIPGAATRLPLLYVKASKSTSGQVTKALSETVKSIVNRHIFQRLDAEFDEELLNSDGHRPLTMTFQSLEIDGSNNNCLNTVALAGDHGTTKLQAMVQDLKAAIEALGWQVAFPADPHGTSSNDNDQMTTDHGFRPRIPFMELPKDFDDNLSRFKDESTIISDEDFEFLNSSEGGNGISPIFWCQWWDDIFGKNIRLKEIAIYPRSHGVTALSSDLSYSMFYLPHETISLPDASSAMMRIEQKYQKYQDERMEEQEREMSSERAVETSSGQDNLDSTFERLEELYKNSAGEESGFMEKDVIEGYVDDTILPKVMHEAIDEASPVDLSPEQQKQISPNDFMDDWMKTRIKNAIESQESEKARKPVKKEMPPIAENPIFKSYKDGTLVPKNELPNKKEKDLGPYPSSGHFAGIWQVVSSPTGFATEESSADRSDNLILRIDGTTAGGPILDPETNQKAAGGTWKMLDGSDGDVTLRIRMLIPPKKERVIEMIGRVNRIGMRSSEIPMASKAFGIPQLEAKARMSGTSDQDEIMMCGGEVYVEDAITKKNRERIGTFSLTKIQGLKDRGDYTITIPKPT